MIRMAGPGNRRRLGRFDSRLATDSAEERFDTNAGTKRDRAVLDDHDDDSDREGGRLQP